MCSPALDCGDALVWVVSRWPVLLGCHYACLPGFLLLRPPYLVLYICTSLNKIKPHQNIDEASYQTTTLQTRFFPRKVSTQRWASMCVLLKNENK